MDFMLSKERQEWEKERKKKIIEHRIENELKDWSEDLKYEKYLTIRASTFKMPSLFKVKPTKLVSDVDNIPKKERVLSPCKNWMYSEVILPRGRVLNCAVGKTIGEVCFDDDVLIPRIHSKYSYNQDRWDPNPWMSLTPQEILTLRAGTRFARGTTVIAGLGMGHQLQRVCARKQVKKVILVERDESLVSWILPRLDLNGKDLEIKIGDARIIVPELTADSALIDIFPNYGWNTFKHCSNIKKMWVWGSAKITGG